MRGLSVSLLAAVALGAIAAAPIASAAPSEQQCLALHCLEVEAPTVSQGRGNVQIFTSAKAMPAMFPHSHNPEWSGLGYDGRWAYLA